ncbi:MAG: type I glyceraldehyde-3-phosphate dehydrogenase [Candidatus Nomurabacteria bacterium]|nr:type I glyceraldehyde-3-phosphate dehydrogenase [Candidatus Nomurabacteria bacterium]
MKKIAINGFGRIGRQAFKVAFERGDIEIVAINDLDKNEILAHLLKHDSTYGEYDKSVDFNDNELIVDGVKIKTFAENDAAALLWKDLGVDVVVECTGHYVEPEKARAHIKAGAKKVIISAPAKGEGADTIVLGVNDEKIDSAGEIISCASCTTNCIAPVMSVLEKKFGVAKAFMTTAHSYTSDQRLLDNAHDDPRRARSAAINIVPTSTGASIAATEAIPELKGVFGGLSLRVPTPDVSIADFAVLLKKKTTIDEVKKVFKEVAKEPFYQGILTVTEDELVSTDFSGNPHSAIVDLPLTDLIDGDFLKVVAWYDNEWAYANRLVELTADIAKTV